jgi:hypothetical protein
MARGKKGIGPPIVQDEPTADQVAATEQPQGNLPEPREPRILSASQRAVRIPVDEKGKINWESMRASTKEEVRKFVGDMLRDRELAASFGIDKPLVEIFPAEWTGALYDSLGAIEAALAPKLLGIDQSIATSIFAYTQAEKEKLAGPTSKVINKYAADWLVRFKEEIALLMLLASITYAKVMAAKMAQRIMDMKSQTPAPKPNGKDHEQVAA